MDEELRARHWIGLIGLFTVLFALEAISDIAGTARKRAHAERVRRHVLERMHAPENAGVIARIHALNHTIRMVEEVHRVNSNTSDRARAEKRLRVLSRKRDLAARMVLAPPDDFFANEYREDCRKGGRGIITLYEKLNESPEQVMRAIRREHQGAPYHKHT